MPYLNHEHLIAALNAFDSARQSFDCQVARVDSDGQEKSTRDVPYGTHGAAFLQVDPVTGAVRCGACAGEMDATAAQKREVPGRKRVHLVSP